MKRLLNIAILLIIPLIMSGCSQSSNSNPQSNTSLQHSNTAPKIEASKYAQSPQELIQNYFKAANNRDEEAAMSCAGIVWDGQLAGFWQNEEAKEFEGATITPIKIEYTNTDSEFDVASAIKDWLALAANKGIQLEYTFSEIKSYGVAYCSLVMTYNGESETVEDAPIYVIETGKGWFMVSIDTAL